MSEFDVYSLEPSDFDAPKGERLHAILGASSSDRWMNCPRSVKLSQGMPNRSSMYAMEGTAAHNLGELCLQQNLSADVFFGQFMSYSGTLWEDKPKLADDAQTVFYEGEQYDERDPVFEINQDMRDAVNMYLHAVEDRFETARKKYKEDPQILIEKTFDLSGVYHDMFGSNDVCLFIPGVYLDVGDYKHGRGKVVKVKHNSQLKYYGLGALRELCLDEFEEPQEIGTFIVQPRVHHPDGRVRGYNYTNREITLDFRRELVAAAKLTEQDDAPIKQGDYCFFCPAKIKCPLITEKIQQSLANTMNDLTPEELGLVPAKAEDYVAQAVASLTSDPQKAAAYFEFLPIMHSVEKEMKLWGKEQLEAGVDIPGQMLVYGDKHRKYKDESIVVERFRTAGFEHKQIYKTELKSASQIEKLGKDAKTVIKELEKEGLIYKPQGEVMIAPVTDTRQKVKTEDDGFSFDL